MSPNGVNSLDAGIVDQHLDRPKSVADNGERAIDLGALGNVGCHGNGRPTRRDDSIGHSLRISEAAAEYAHRHTVAGKPQARRLADTGSTAGDDRDFHGVSQASNPCQVGTQRAALDQADGFLAVPTVAGGPLMEDRGGGHFEIVVVEHR